MVFFRYWVNSIYTYQKIPVKSIKIFIQREEKEEVKHKQEYESCEHDHEKERQMRRTVKRSVKLTKYKGYQKEYLYTEKEEQLNKINTGSQTY